MIQKHVFPSCTSDQHLSIQVDPCNTLAMKTMRATLKYIQCITEIKHRTLQYIFKRACNHSWDPSTCPHILDGYVIDTPHTGSKVKITCEFEQQIPKKVTSDQFGREKSYIYIAA